MVIRDEGAWYWLGSGDPPLHNKGDGIKRSETLVKSMVSVDSFTVPTIRFQVLVRVSGAGHQRRRILHFGVMACPTAEWTTQQLREPFPWETAPRYLLRDRDRIFGADFVKQVNDMGIREVLGAPRVPQQRAYIERVIGTIRRECLDDMIVFDQASLLRHLKSFLVYYHETRTHLALEKDPPQHREVQRPASGSSGSDTAGWRLASPIRATGSVTRL
jgi:hypothetical protein